MRPIETTERVVAATALGAALAAHHEESAQHSLRVAAYAARLARELRLDATRANDLYFGALMHDVGKIAVAQSVLNKPFGERLTEDEWAQLREHPAAGADMLRGLDISPRTLRVILEHHERWDGKGYPRGLAGSEISLEARICAVADAYDAITADRCYRRGEPDAVARHEIVSAGGTQFDPYVVDALARVTAEDLQTALTA